LTTNSDEFESVLIYRFEASSKENEDKYGVKTFYFVGNLESQYLVVPATRSSAFDSEFNNPIVAIRNTRSLNEFQFLLDLLFPSASQGSAFKITKTLQNSRIVKSGDFKFPVEHEAESLCRKVTALVSPHEVLSFDPIVMDVKFEADPLHSFIVRANFRRPLSGTMSGDFRFAFHTHHSAMTFLPDGLKAIHEMSHHDRMLAGERLTLNSKTHLLRPSLDFFYELANDDYNLSLFAFDDSDDQGHVHKLVDLSDMDFLCLFAAGQNQDEFEIEPSQNDTPLIALLSSEDSDRSSEYISDIVSISANNVYRWIGNRWALMNDFDLVLNADCHHVPLRHEDLDSLMDYASDPRDSLEHVKFLASLSSGQAQLAEQGDLPLELEDVQTGEYWDWENEPMVRRWTCFLIPEENGYDVVPIDTVIERHSQDPDIPDTEVKFVLALDEELEVKNLQVITKAGAEYERHNGKWVKRPGPYYSGENEDWDNEFLYNRGYTFVPCQWFITSAFDHEKAAGRTMKVIPSQDVSEPLKWEFKGGAVLLNPVLHDGPAADEDSVPWLKFAPKTFDSKWLGNVDHHVIRAVLTDDFHSVLCLLALVTNENDEVEFFERVDGKWLALPWDHYLRGDQNYLDVLDSIVEVYDFEHSGGRDFASSLLIAHLSHSILDWNDDTQRLSRINDEIQVYGPGGGHFMPSEIPTLVTSTFESIVVTDERTSFYEYYAPLTDMHRNQITGIRERCDFYDKSVDQGEFEPILHSLHMKKGSSATSFVEALVATHLPPDGNVRYND
jgi:hypothetical protein